jgi:DNA repair exonuclease SbcCD ATPase subunit
MGAAARDQQQLNERSRELTQRLSEQMRIGAGDRAELRRLADEQARLRQELGDIQREDEQRRQLLGRLDQARKEMEQVEEQLRSGEPGADLEERQNHILSRMLDAQRSINRRDFDPQREARRGEDVARSSPPPLPAAMLRDDERLRLDLMKADADRYPAQYRALVERYLQRLNGSPR